MNRIKLAYVIMIVSIILMIAHLIVLDYSNFKILDLLSPLSNILLILAMYFTIKGIKKNEQNSK